MTLGIATLKCARKLSDQIAAQYAEYREDCAEWARRGYRPHYCEHGTDLWTDYDNICFGCEDGFSLSDPVTRRREALNLAKERMAKATELIRFVSQAGALGISDAVDSEKVWAKVTDLMLLDSSH